MQTSQDKTSKQKGGSVRAPIGRKSLTKTDRLITLLKRKSGQDIVQLTTALGWLPHTVRGALSRLRKSGLNVERVYGPNGRPRYRIGAGAKQ